MASLSNKDIQKQLLGLGLSSLDGTRIKPMDKNPPPSLHMDQAELQHQLQTQGYSTLDGQKMTPGVVSRLPLYTPIIERSIAKGQAAAALEHSFQTKSAAKRMYVEAATMLSHILPEIRANQRLCNSLRSTMERYIEKAERIAAELEQVDQAVLLPTVPTPSSSSKRKEDSSNLKDLLQQAIDADQAGEYSEALRLYKQGIQSLFDNLHGIPATDLVGKTDCETALMKYMDRAEIIKAAIDSDGCVAAA